VIDRRPPDLPGTVATAVGSAATPSAATAAAGAAGADRSTPLRRLVIVNWRDSAHPLAGGAEVYCESVAQQAHDSGLEVTLLTSRSAGAPRSEQTAFGSIVRRGGRFTVYPRALWWLWRHRSSIDAVLDSQNGIPFFAPLALRRRTPTILLIHHVHQQQFALYFPWPLTVIGRLLEKNVSAAVYGTRAICVVSPSSRSEVRRQLSFRGPVYVAPCGQDQPPGDVVTDAVRSEQPSIVCVGRLAPNKRLHLLVDAVARVPSVTLHLVGDGEARAELEQQVRALGLTERVVLHGRLPADARDELLAAAWLTASTSAGEGWGLAVTEAAAFGVPAVALDVPGLRDSVRPGRTGWLVPVPPAAISAADDRGALVAAVAAGLDTAVRELSDPVAARAYADDCRAWAATFSWAATTDQILRVLTAESQRLTHPGANRLVTDASTVVRVDATAVGLDGDAPWRRLRLTDQLDTASGDVRILLRGADERGAVAAMTRLGVTPAMIEARVARHADLLGWPAREDGTGGPAAGSSGAASSGAGSSGAGSSGAGEPVPGSSVTGTSVTGTSVAGTSVAARGVPALSTADSDGPERSAR
jgi:glycosyltransferase involved in cell wall biosynthesis